MSSGVKLGGVAMSRWFSNIFRHFILFRVYFGILNNIDPSNMPMFLRWFNSYDLFLEQFGRSCTLTYATVSVVSVCYAYVIYQKQINTVLFGAQHIHVACGESSTPVRHKLNQNKIAFAEYLWWILFIYVISNCVNVRDRHAKRLCLQFDLYCLATAKTTAAIKANRARVRVWAIASMAIKGIGIRLPKSTVSIIILMVIDEWLRIQAHPTFQWTVPYMQPKHIADF